VNQALLRGAAGLAGVVLGTTPEFLRRKSETQAEEEIVDADRKPNERSMKHVALQSRWGRNNEGQSASGALNDPRARRALSGMAGKALLGSSFAFLSSGTRPRAPLASVR
jgi:hypothetical protein